MDVAQQDPGFYLRVSQGPAFVTLHAASSYTAPSRWGAGGMTDIAIGWTVADGFSLASFFDVDYVGLNDGAGTLTLLAFGATFDWHPVPTTGWRAGGAMGGSDVIVDTEGHSNSSGNAMFALFGGYDWWLSRRWGLGVEARFSYFLTTNVAEVPSPPPTGMRFSDDVGYWRFATAVYTLGVSVVF